MKLKLAIEHFTIDLLDALRDELKPFEKCEIRQNGTTVEVSCETDTMKECMKIVKIIDKYNIISIQDHQKK